MVGWLPISALQTLFYFGCVQEVKKLEWHPRSRTPFHICFSSFGVCLPMTSMGRPTYSNMSGNDPLAFSMALIALQWQAKGEEAAAAASKASWESNWRQQQSSTVYDRCC